MKNKILKILTVVSILIALIATNFIYVGVGLVSYAISDTATNHQNVEFDVELREDNILTMQIGVKKEGYFNGEIALENSNFNFVTEQSNNYINKIEKNKIVLNQLNAGSTAKIDLKIEPINEEIFNVGLLNVVSKLNLTGIYRDSTQKDINIKASREVELKYAENNTEEDMVSTVDVITNKVMKVSGEDKRVVQLEVNLGLKDNNYPIKEIDFQMEIPTVDGKQPVITKKIDFNNTTHWDYKYENSKVQIKFTNEQNEQNNILWRKQGNEKIILTLIYEKDATIENLKYENTVNDSTVGQPNVKLTLYDEKEISTIAKIDKEQLSQEKDSLINVTINDSEDVVYKGKLYAGIDRQYESTTNLAINLANAAKYIDIKENSTNYIVEDKEVTANVIYNKTIINKEDFDKIFGQDGTLTITNENGEIIATVNNTTAIDENKNIVIDYTGKEPNSIEIKTTTPIIEGNLTFTHIKTIKGQNRESIEKSQELKTKLIYNYDTGIENEAESTIKLEEAKTEATLQVNKETLSTVIENNVEMRAILKGNNEQYNLYSNPTIKIELPQEVEKISINSIDLMYETELKIKNYIYDENESTLTIYLEGRQTEYKDVSIDGTILVVNANIVINRKTATKESQITMTCDNEGLFGKDAKSIKIVAPTDVTTINAIKDLNIETTGEEELKSVTLQRGTSKKQLEAEFEVINNNENEIQNVKILGTFPTKNDENNMDIKVVEGISIQGAEDFKIYYTENINATDDLQNTANGWAEEIKDTNKVSKYLIELASIQSEETLQGTYKIEIPALLEYNKISKEGYNVKYTNSLTKTEKEIKSTQIELQTGVGPVLETKLTPIIGAQEVEANSTVKNGEVIKYKIEISNTGSEEIKDISIEGNIPEGTTLVVPQENYEYTGASYYKELNDKTYETKIETLQVGQVITAEYEVRVNNNVVAGKKLANIINAKYGDVIKQSNESVLLTSNGNIRVSVKRVTDRNVGLYENGTVRYFAIIENISKEEQDNVTVKTNISNNLSVNRLTLKTGMKAQDIFNDDIYRTESDQQYKETRQNLEGQIDNEESSITTEELQYNENVNIGKLKTGEVKVLSYDMLINKINDIDKINVSVVAKQGNDEHRSNVITENIKKIDVSLSMTTNTQSQYVKSGDIIEYYITVKNNGNSRVEGIEVFDSIPKSLTVNSISFDGEEIEKLEDNNEIEILCDISEGSESTIKIETIVNYSTGRTSAEAITNVAYAEFLGDKVATTQEVNHIIQADAEENEETDDNEDEAGGKAIITGVAWFDKNANGKKDDDEERLSNIKVHLLNTETNNLVKDENGNILESTTNDKGLYVLDRIKNGKYIVIFEYDSTKYALTKYKAQNVEEANNSDVITNELTIEDERQQVASTDIIEVHNNNISDINIGLIELKDFSFRLDKYVNRILIQNSAGTTVKEYDNAHVAKAEIDAKKVNGSMVIIEYKIKATNIGDVDGYIKKIVDYVPSDLKFNSEMNTDWYTSGENLYNISLANEKIKSGESREVILTLTKSMTEDNMGLINNTAEIAESYNELGLSDSKSNAGNRVQGEEDYSSADAILSLKTGGEVYIVSAIIIVVVLGTIAFIIIRRKKVLNGDNK